MKELLLNRFLKFIDQLATENHPDCEKCEYRDQVDENDDCEMATAYINGKQEELEPGDPVILFDPCEKARPIPMDMPTMNDICFLHVYVKNRIGALHKFAKAYPTEYQNCVNQFEKFGLEKKGD